MGPSEIVVIVAVGWLLLGPQKLFSLAKDSGKLLGELKRTADDAKSTFSEAMDVELMNAELKSDEKAKKGELKGSEGDSANGNGAEKSQFDEITPIMSAKEVPEVSDDDAAESAVLDSVFLDQLKRVSDPQQKAPVNLPDLDVNDGDEFELQRLEEQYLEARKRLEDRRKEVNQRSNTEDVSQNEN